MNHITDIVTVKNAIFVEQDNIYYVIHYGTEIFKYDGNSHLLLKCLRNISMSSSRAIGQAISYLNLDLKGVPRNLGEDI